MTLFLVRVTHLIRCTDKMMNSSFEMFSLSIRRAIDVLCIMCNVMAFIWERVDVILPFLDM